MDANDGAITTNTGNININGTNIGNNSTSAGTNNDDISTNNGHLTTLEASVKNLGGDNDIATSFGNISSILIDYGSRISTLENSGGSSGGSSSTFTIADNPIIYVNCSTGSLQQAIERSPLHGKVIIEISGTCTDDIYLRKSLTIRGNPDIQLLAMPVDLAVQQVKVTTLTQLI
ncbi:MAG: hypothetical protein Rsou_1679 [Candidatus Ruthia sp. Asou_11_S2]|nr:hypothetical protein [Candidatus Ruthia sp. Asou_11_S2]